MCGPDQLRHRPEPLPSPTVTPSPEAAAVRTADGVIHEGISKPTRILFSFICFKTVSNVPHQAVTAEEMMGLLVFWVLGGFCFVLFLFLHSAYLQKTH